MKTLKYLNKMSRQAIYDKVRDHLLAQKKKSVTAKDKSLCAYRGVGGLKCAAGVLIPDECYSELWEGSNAEYVFVGVKHLNLIMRLQLVHDTVHAKSWEKKLTEVANEFNLKP